MTSLQVMVSDWNVQGVGGPDMCLCKGLGKEPLHARRRRHLLRFAARSDNRHLLRQIVCGPAMVHMSSVETESVCVVQATARGKARLTEWLAPSH